MTTEINRLEKEAMSQKRYLKRLKIIVLKDRKKLKD